MIHTIAEILKSKFVNFDYVDKCAGIVQTATKKKGDKVYSKFLLIILPIEKSTTSITS